MRPSASTPWPRHSLATPFFHEADDDPAVRAAFDDDNLKASVSEDGENSLRLASRDRSRRNKLLDAGEAGTVEGGGDSSQMFLTFPSAAPTLGSEQAVPLSAH